MTRKLLGDYEAYGLRVRSSVPLPFARVREDGPAAGEPDVVVRLGATPAALPGPADRRRTPGGRAAWEAAPDAFLISLHGVARCLVTGGRDVLVEPRGGDDREIGMCLAGTVWAALLLQRGIVTFHASAVEFETGAVLFLGRSGAGKSSLLGALLKRGRAMLADDVAGVVLDAGGRPVALPAYPRLRLCADVVDALGWRGQAREKEWMQPEKYRMPVPPFPRFAATHRRSLSADRQPRERHRDRAGVADGGVRGAWAAHLAQATAERAGVAAGAFSRGGRDGAAGAGRAGGAAGAFVPARRPGRSHRSARRRDCPGDRVTPGDLRRTAVPSGRTPGSD